MDRMKELVETLNKYAHAYYVEDNPIVSDADYDKLYDELVLLEKQTGIVLPSSPTLRVGGETLKAFKKYEHKARLYSLDKAQNLDEVKKWVDGIKKIEPDATFCVEYKFDGLSIVVHYQDGILKSAGTRGNGSVGEDVTEQVKTIKSVPLSIPYKGEVVIQGEGMVTLSNLKKYNASHKDQLKNARNAVAGAIRNLDPKQTAERNLDLFAYNVNFKDGEHFSGQVEMREFLRENGFKLAPYFVTLSSVDEIEKQINEIDKIKSKLDILMDGLVIKLNKTKNREKIGYTAKFPKWALAYKFAPQEVTSTLREVVWQVGRTGKLTPIAIVDPVFLAGATVTRATLNNMGDIVRKGVKIGSTVFIRRSNEVIPEILSIAEEKPNSVEIEPPKVCPACGSEVTEVGANLFCVNRGGCSHQIIDKLAHFGSKEAMNIEGFSDKTAEQLFINLGITRFEQIYSLSRESLLELENFKDKKADNLLDAIEKSKKVQLANFIFALGISNVGTKTAKDLAKTFGSLDGIKNASLEELSNVRDIGEIIAPIIFDYFKKPENLETINSLISYGVEIKNTKASQENKKFAGLSFVLTGTLENYTRGEMTALIEKNGGEVSSSVSKNTSYVLAGENAGSKLTKAETLGVRIISEQQILEMLK